MKPASIALEDIRRLGEPCLITTIPLSWGDRNGHMNMRWYVAIFDDAGDELHARVGITEAYHDAHDTGTVDLEHHTHFLAEVMLGNEVTVYARVVGQSDKRVHYLMFLIDETRGRLAAISECVNSWLDLKSRKTAPFPDEIASKVTAALAADAKQNWPAPTCGAMRA